MPRDVAVVVGAQRDDEQVEAALELVLGVGDVGGEVRRLAGRALEDAVLVVAERRSCAATARPRSGTDGPRSDSRSMPPLDGSGCLRAARLVEVGVARACERSGSTRSGARAARLAEEDVVLDAVGAQRRLDALEHQLDADARELVGVHLGGARDLRGQLADVVALVAALGHLLAARPRADRLAELLDLRPGVVEVVLAHDVVAGEAEHARQRVAVGGVAPAGRRQRPGRVGRDELDVDAQRGGRAGAAEAVAGREHPVERARRTRGRRGRGSGSPARRPRRAPGRSPSRSRSAPPSRSATSRGGALSSGASTSAAFVA